jgi:hypothetical protein
MSDRDLGRGPTGEPLDPQPQELTMSDGRKVRLTVAGLAPPVKPRATEQRGSAVPPRDDPRLPLDPNFIGPP